MKAITLRNIPSELAKILEREAAKTGRSLNKTVLTLLEKATGARGSGQLPVRFHDLDDLTGSWTPKQAREFEGHLEELRQIDSDLWV